jgi:hypothetical protein
MKFIEFCLVYWTGMVMAIAVQSCGSAPSSSVLPVGDTAAAPTEVFVSKTYNMNSTTLGPDVNGFSVKTIVHLPSSVTVTNGASPSGKTVYIKLNSMTCRYLWYTANVMNFVDCNGSTTKDYTLQSGTITLDSTGSGLSVNAFVNTEELKQ